MPSDAPFRRRGAAQQPAPVRVTDAKASRVEDQQARMIKYLILNGMRVVCLILVFVTPRQWWWLWITGAVIFPYLGVLVANNIGEKHPGSVAGVDTSPGPGIMPFDQAAAGATSEGPGPGVGANQPPQNDAGASAHAGPPPHAGWSGARHYAPGAESGHNEPIPITGEIISESSRPSAPRD